MKTLRDHMLVYDGDCPMCTMYSNAFVKARMLGQTGIIDYNSMTDEIRNHIDINRARNEIALVDTANHTVHYGIESWMKIIATSFSPLKWLFSFPPFYWFMKGLYNFISYNRKVIAPGKEFFKAGSCYPDFNATWRWIYIFITSIFVALILSKYFGGIPVYNHGHIFFGEEWLIAIGQLAFQGSIVFFLRKERMVHYFGHLMTIAMMGALLLLPVIIIKNIFTNLPQELYIAYFAIPVIIMLWQHIRRVKILELPSFLTFTWLLYRALLLITFFIFSN